MYLDSNFFWWADVISTIGLVMTAAGATIAARAVILTPKDAVHIGVARYSSGNDTDDLKLPSVQNLIKASRAAQLGLWLVVAGTGLQIGPAVARIAAPYLG